MTVAILATALLSSCGAQATPASGPGGSKAAATTLQPIIIAYSSEGSIAQITPYVAEQKGYFKDYGLNVTRFLVRGNAESAAALVSGQVQVANSGLEGIFAAAMQGGVQPFVLATPEPRYAYSIVAAPEITSVKDLIGKTVVMGNTTGTEADYALAAEFKALGLPPNSWVRVGGGPNAERVATLESGHAMATLLDPPYDMMMEAKGFRIVAHIYEDVKTPVPATVFYATRGYVEQHRPEMTAMLKAVIKSIRFMKANPAEAKQLMAAWTKLGDPKGLDYAYHAYFEEMFTSEPIPALDAIQTSLDNAANARKQASTFKAEQFTDASFVQQALDELKKEPT